jgi:signal transduction histidine kinase
VSATTSATRFRKRLPRRSQRPSHPIELRLAMFAVTIVDIGILAVGISFAGTDLLASSWELAFWAVAAAAVGFAVIRLPSGQTLAMDMPVLLAAGYLFGPIPAGIVAFAGYIDVREFHREISLERALFNRAQISLSVMAAAAAFSLVSPGVNELPLAALGALLAVGVDSVINLGLVSFVMALNDHVTPSASLSRLRLGPVLAYAAFGFQSLLLAEVYSAVGPWGLALFAMPILLAREAFQQGQSLYSAEMRLNIQGRALQQATDRIADERRDERLAVASGLHDDVLPPLFKVHLLGQVLRQELSTGQLLAMEDDLPELLRATNEASNTLRSVIRDLRTSPLGAGGLSHTLQLLVRELEGDSTVTFEAHIEEVKGTPVVELLAYQTAREALRNSMKHSRASRVKIVLRHDGEAIQLNVYDNGAGFSPHLVDASKHFGLALMQERIELAGGSLQIDSSPGMGTRLTARFPSDQPKT